MNRRSWTILIAALMALILMLSACGDSTPAPGGDSTTPPATGGTGGGTVPATGGGSTDESDPVAMMEAEGTANYPTRVSVSHNITDADMQVDNRLYDYFSAKFQIDMVYIPMQFGERFEKARLWAASNDLPDLLWNDLNENIYTEWTQWVDAGLFAPLPDDLTPWPNLQNVKENTIKFDLLSRNGQVYAIGAVRDEITEDFTVPIGIPYRADWAEAVGKRQPNDIYTWDQWIDMIQTCMAEDPGGNGAGKTFGWAAAQFYFPEAFGIWQASTVFEWGFEEPMYMVIDGEYKWYPSTPEYIKGLKEAKRLYDMGVIWPDIVLDTGSTQYNDLFYGGQMVATVGNVAIGALRSARDRMSAAFPDVDRRLCVMPAKVDSPFDANHFWQKQSPPYWGASSFSAKTTEEQRTRILDIYDWLMSEDGIDFRLYGIPGEDYVRNGDNVEVFWAKNDAGNYVDPYSGQRGFYGRAILNNLEVNYGNVTVPQEDRDDAWASWKWDCENAKVGKVDLVMIYCSTPNKDRLGFFVADTKAKAIELLQNSTYDNIEAEWQAWVDSMMPKVQLVLDDLNALPYIPQSYADQTEALRGGYWLTGK